MKRNLLALFAIVLAIAFSAFIKPVKSAKLFTTVYMVYDGEGDQKLISNYSQLSEYSSCTGGTALCAAIVNDGSGSVSQTEWFDVNNQTAGYFYALDTDHDNILEDESTNVQKKF